MLTALQDKAPTVMVVDDSASIRELLRIHLSNAGYEVIAAEDAIVAGRALLASPPDLMIVDVHMPYMDGVEFVSAVKADPEVPDIPVIFLSASPDVDDHASRLRAVAFLAKPVSIARLLEVVALHVGTPALGAAVEG